MDRMYELGFIVEPRQTDDEVKAISERFEEMIESSGARITFKDYWGKRKLAYSIKKVSTGERLTEGKYVFLYVNADKDLPPWSDIERLMMQDERILRHLVVRTDQDWKRALRKSKVTPVLPGAEPAPEAEASTEEDA